MEEVVMFIPYGKNKSHYMSVSGPNHAYRIVYYDGDSDGYLAYEEGSWMSEDYRTITFDGTQTVSKEFYDWFTANAKPALSGTWVFNEELIDIINGDIPTGEVSFSSNSTSFSCISTPKSNGNIYYNWIDSSELGIAVYDGAWVDSAYRTITFDGTQTVSKEFYDWFVSNAQPALSGTWIFNETLTPTWVDTPFQEYEESITFECNGSVFCDIQYIITDFDEYLSYGIETYQETVYDTAHSWYNQSWRTITLSGTQTVSKEFYDWFTANAQPALYGQYGFYETISIPEPFSIDIPFTSNSTAYTMLTFTDGAGGDMFYDMTKVYSADTGIWESEGYRIINITSLTVVPNSVYKWFIANTQIITSPPIA